jgi:hypothetical protein
MRLEFGRILLGTARVNVKPILLANEVNARAQSLKIDLVGALENNSAHPVCVANARTGARRATLKCCPVSMQQTRSPTSGSPAAISMIVVGGGRGDDGIDFPIDLLHWLLATAQCAKGSKLE